MHGSVPMVWLIATNVQKLHIHENHIKIASENQSGELHITPTPTRSFVMCNKMLFSRRIHLIETLLYGWWYTVVLFTYLCIYQINVSRHRQFLYSGGRVWPPLQLFLSAVSTHKAKQRTFKHIQSSQWHPTLNSRSWGHRLLKEKVQLVLTRTITGLKKK